MDSLLLILRNRRYFAPVWLFASLNIVIGTWVLYIPTVKERLALDDGDIGLAIFGFSLGLLSVIPFSSSILKRFGLGRVSFISVVVFGALMCLPVIAPTYALLCASLYCCGVFASLTDIGMNSMVSELEQEDDVHFMSAAHGFFSLGGVIGAGIGSFVLEYLPLLATYHSALVALLILTTNLLLAMSYFHRKSKVADRGAEGKFRFGLIRPLAGLAILSIIIMGSEGAIEHWSKLYLLDIVQVDSALIAGFGFVAFSATMTLGRFLGDGISERFGALAIIIGGSTLAACGFALILTTSLWVAMAGFALVGLGFSVIIPELFRLAGRARGISPAEGISVVAGLGYAGFLASPALLGFLSDLSSLWLSFLVLLFAALTASAVAILIRFRQRRTQAGT